MIANVNSETGVRYGVIACQSLDQDLVNDLFYGSQAVNISEEEGCREILAEVTNEVDDLIAQGQIEAEDRDDEIADRTERAMDHWDGPDQPVIEGVLEGVTYAITWLGGAPLLTVLHGPKGYANRLCSPCVPNAGDLDSGFTLEGETDDLLVSGYECYVVPRDWLHV